MNHVGRAGVAWVIASALVVTTAACTLILSRDDLSAGGDPDGGGSTEAGTDAETGTGCSATRVDCDGKEANGCETDLNEDPSSCGACGRSCLDGTCESGKCQPFALATGQDTPSVLTTDETHVYWTNQGGAGAVMRIAKEGGEPEVVGVTDRPPGGLAVDDQTVFWSEVGSGSENHVWRLDKADIGTSVPPTVLQSGQSPSLAVAVDDTNVYWVTTGTVRTKLKTGGPTTTLASDQDSVPFYLVVDLDHLYWTTHIRGQVMGIDLSEVDAGPRKLAGGQDNPTGLTSDFANLYWLNFQGDADGGTPKVMRIAKVNMDEPEVLADGQSGPTIIRANGSDLFWSNNVDGTIMRMSKSGGTPQVVAEGQGAPAGLDVDATAVYWVNRDGGQVMALAR